jgi:hypothetical protein
MIVTPPRDIALEKNKGIQSLNASSGGKYDRAALNTSSGGKYDRAAALAAKYMRGMTKHILYLVIG